MKKLFDKTEKKKRHKKHDPHDPSNDLPVSVGAKKEVVFVFSSIVAIAEGKNVIAQLCAVKQGGVD